MPDFNRLHEITSRLARATAPGQQEPGLASWCMFVGEDWKPLAEMWSPIIAPDKPAGWDEPDRLNRENANQEPVPANPPSSGVSDAEDPLMGLLDRKSVV